MSIFCENTDIFMNFKGLIGLSIRRKRNPHICKYLLNINLWSGRLSTLHRPLTEVIMLCRFADGKYFGGDSPTTLPEVYSSNKMVTILFNYEIKRVLQTS